MYFRRFFASFAFSYVFWGGVFIAFSPSLVECKSHLPSTLDAFLSEKLIYHHDNSFYVHPTAEKGYGKSLLHLLAQHFEEQEILSLNKGNLVPKKILEIRFTSGHVADLLLEQFPQVEVISFDQKEYPYTKFAQRYVDRKYPKRHQCMNGKIETSLASFLVEHTDLIFDAILIHGAPSYEYFLPELRLLKNHLNEATLIIISGMEREVIAKEWEKAKKELSLVEWNRYEEEGRSWVVGSRENLVNQIETDGSIQKEKEAITEDLIFSNFFDELEDGLEILPLENRETLFLWEDPLEDDRPIFRKSLKEQVENETNFKEVIQGGKDDKR